MRWFIALAALSLIGCKDTTTDGVDADGDGVLVADDCDDTNPNVNPNAIERCNGIDDNCDGVVDEGVTVTFYADADADTYGDPDTPIEACTLPDNAVTNTEDCDDTDFDIAPGVVELCDDIDHNCDGDPLEGAIASTYFWRDADNDGFGNPQDSSRACEAPGSDWVPGGDLSDRSIIDCDDDDPLTNPGADELCGTSTRNVDENCNGIFDDNPVDGTEFPVDQDNDGFGSATATASVCTAGDLADLDGDGQVETATTEDSSDCDDTLSSIRPGVPELCDGIDNDCDPSTNEDDVATDTRQWWFDNDNDGSGNPANEVLSCEMPTGYVSAQNGEDCDDADDARSPSQLEVCDGVDNDCDILVDNSAIDALDFYLDDDGDGLGDPSIQPILQCEATPSRVLDNTDCDDADALVLGPDAQFFDQDLDTYGDPMVTVSSCDPEPGYVYNDLDCDDLDDTLNPDTPWYTDLDGDGFGISEDDDPALGETMNSCVQPIGFARESGDCDEADVTFNPGAVDAPADGLDQDCDGFADDDALTDHCGPITANEIWGNQFIHTVTCDVIVDGASLPHLVIQEGAIVRFVDGARMLVGTDQGGSLEASRVIFEHEDRVQPGRWNGLSFGQVLNVATPTVLRDSIIRDAAGFGIRVNGSEVTLDNVHISDTIGPAVSLQNDALLHMTASRLENNIGPGVEAFDGQAQLGTFTNNTITGNTFPLTVSAASLEELRADVDPPAPLDPPVELGGTVDPIDPRTNVLTGNDSDVVTLLDGTMVQDTTWTDALGVDYLVDGLVVVGDGAAPELFVEDGVEATFTSGSGIQVGTNGFAGSLVIDGTLAAGDYGVVFDSVAQTPGSWRGIQLGASANDSSIAGLDLRNGGASQAAALLVVGDGLDDADNRVRFDFVDSRVFGSASTGLTVDAAKPAISDAIFDSNGEHGFELLADVVNADLLISNVESTDNADSGARVYPAFVHKLDGNTFTGNDLPLEITGGLVEQSVTWNALSEDYYVSGPVTVENSGAAPILTITDSVRMYFGDLGELLIGTNAQGSIKINEAGGPAVVMTALAEYEGLVPVNGAWAGVTIGRFQRESLLTDVDISYAGKNANSGALFIFGETVPITLDGVTVENSGSDGLFTSDFNNLPGPTLSIIDSVFQNNDDIGVNLRQGVLAAPGLVGTRVEGNGLHGLALAPEAVEFLELNDPSDMLTNTFTSNNLVNDPTGNEDFIEVIGGDITVDTTFLDHGIPYQLTSDSMRVRQGAVLTIEPGVTVEVESDLSLEIIIGRNSLPGGIVAMGTAAEPIRFVSAANVPSRGDWVGLSLGGSCLTTSDLTLSPPVLNRCVLDYVEIAHAGDQIFQKGLGALDVYVRNPVTQPDPVLITHTVIRESVGYGMSYYWDAEGGQIPFNQNDLPSPQGGDPRLQFSCEDLDGNQICDSGESVAGYCWDNADSRHGETNYFCDGTLPNALVTYLSGGRVIVECPDNGPLTCGSLPDWTAL